MAIAEAYLGSFRPVQKVEGFGDVLSSAGMNALGAIPGINANFEAQLAAKVLGESAATDRLQRNLDAIAAENDLTRRSNRRLAGTRMASALLQSAFPGAGSPAGVEVGDPLALLTSLGNFSQGERQRRASNTLRSNTYAAELLKGLS